ncbi:MAG: ABC transporter ATP-binding protein [Chloroflexota bacterium]|jgi:branched-chain amino acid transport system ATP-binding protein
MPVLELKDVDAGYGEVQILWGTTLALQEGKLTSLVGANGAGKTTMLRTTIGLIKPWHGAIFFDGKDVSKLAAHTKAEMGLVLVPEGRQLFGSMSVQENLEMGAAPLRARSLMRQNMERVYNLFPRLKERAQQKASTLSGGEQQMLAVGRGLMGNPIVLLFDELSLGLSPVLVLQMFEILMQLKQTGLTILLVEQNVQMALAASDYCYVLNQGRIEMEGLPQDFIGNEHIRHTYLGL